MSYTVRKAGRVVASGLTESQARNYAANVGGVVTGTASRKNPAKKDKRLRVNRKNSVLQPGQRIDPLPNKVTIDNDGAVFAAFANEAQAKQYARALHRTMPLRTIKVTRK